MVLPFVSAVGSGSRLIFFFFKVQHYLIVSVSPEPCTGAVSASDVLDSLFVLCEEQVPDPSIASTAVRHPNKHPLPKQGRGSHPEVFYILISSSSARCFAFLLIKHKSSVLFWFSRKVLGFYASCVLFLNYFNAFVYTLKCISGSLRLCDSPSSPPHLLFFFLPNQRVQRVRMTSCFSSAYCPASHFQ